jgi:hypothetical protein
LELAFQSKELRAICESESEAASELGAAAAEALKHRLADMRAASSINDVLVGQPKLVDGKGGEEIVLELSDQHRVFFSANHVKNPMNDSNFVDWTKVTRIKILRIVKNEI